jgi:hypothetical protein
MCIRDMTLPDALELHTPPESVHSPPLTPPASNAKPKPSPQAPRIVKLLRSIQQGRIIELQPWCVFRLEPGDYDEFRKILESDDDLRAFVQDKVRYV